MKKIIFSSLIALVFFACDKENETDSQQLYNLAVGMEFSLFNSNGEDLLDPNTPSNIKEEDIKIFYLINGEYQEVYEQHLDNPRMFRIYQHENEYRVAVFPNFEESEETPITLIQWNELETDTIAISLRRNNNAVIQDNIWLNGNLIWSIGDNTVNPYFVIQK